jgi:hypothetical protein
VRQLKLALQSNSNLKVLKICVTTSRWDAGFKLLNINGLNEIAETLGKLIRNPDEGVRVWAAANKNTPSKSLWRAAQKETPQVRRAVAQNKVGDIKLLRYLADDPDWEVRKAVSENWNTPDDLVKQIKAGGLTASLRQLVRRMV